MFRYYFYKDSLENDTKNWILNYLCRTVNLEDYNFYIDSNNCSDCMYVEQGLDNVNGGMKYIGLQDFCDYVIKDFPTLERGMEFDVEYEWREWTATEEGWKFLDWAQENQYVNFDYDSAIENIDYTMVSDCYNIHDLKDWLDKFIMRKELREAVVRSFEECEGYYNPETGKYGESTSMAFKDYGSYDDMKDEYWNDESVFIVDTDSPLNSESVALVYNAESIKELLGLDEAPRLKKQYQ